MSVEPFPLSPEAAAMTIRATQDRLLEVERRLAVAQDDSAPLFGALADFAGDLYRTQVVAEANRADFAEMRRILDECRTQSAAMLAEVKKAADRPLLTPHQLHNDALPKLVANINAKVLFRMLAALVVTAVVFAGSGLATGWWWFKVPLTCGPTVLMTQTGPRYICWQDNGPAPRPPSVMAEPPESTAPPQPIRPQQPTKR